MRIMKVVQVASLAALLVACSSSSSPGGVGSSDGLYSTTCPISGGTPCTSPSDIVCVTEENQSAFKAKYGADCVGQFCSGVGCIAIGNASNGDTAYCCPASPLNPGPDASYMQP